MTHLIRRLQYSSGAALTAWFSASSAMAHEAIVPHAHPHESTWLLDHDAAVIATLANAGLLTLVALLSARCYHTTARDRKQGRS